MKLTNLNKIVITSTLLVLGACSSSDNNDDNGTGTISLNDDNGTGTISLNVTDAPIDKAAEVVVEFSGVTLKPAGGEDIVFTFDPPKSIDLLALQGTLSQPLLENEVIPAGDYNQIRLHVNAEDNVVDSYIVLTVGGAQEELKVPSGSQSGLKLNTPFTVDPDTSNVGVGDFTTYTIDFDLRKSIVNPSAPNQPYFLKPSLRLVQNADIGSISGTVDVNLLDFAAGCSDDDLTTGNAIYAYAGADVAVIDDVGSATGPLTTALVALNTDTGLYEYEIGFIKAGTYTLAFTCQADNDLETDDDIVFSAPINVTVEAGQETRGQNF